jgi:hypothetical protein
MSEVEVALFPPDEGPSGEYGRDFYMEEVGFGRMEVRMGSIPLVRVEFLDTEDSKVIHLKAKSNLELSDAIDDEEIAAKIARFAFKGLNR